MKWFILAMLPISIYNIARLFLILIQAKRRGQKLKWEDWAVLCTGLGGAGLLLSVALKGGINEVGDKWLCAIAINLLIIGFITDIRTRKAYSRQKVESPFQPKPEPERIANR